LDIYDLRWLDLMAGSRLAELAPSAPEVGQFLIELFDLWFYDQQRQVDFQELRQEVKMILQPEVDRGDPFHKKRCDLRRLIFSPDGRVFSCDQWVHDERTALGDIHRDSLALILKNKVDLWAAIKTRLRRSGDDMACGPCDWGRQCAGGCLTCIKYNALLLQARSQGLPDHRWVEANLPPGWETLLGETYYCDGLRAFRRHVQETVRREFANAD
jgi:radical SAM protein with 4Fe4S-binding SPASM domain